LILTNIGGLRTAAVEFYNWIFELPIEKFGQELPSTMINRTTL